MAYSWPDAEAKARAALAFIRTRAERSGLQIEEWHEEYFGIDGFGGATVASDDRPDDPPEVTARLAWRTATAELATAVQRLVLRIDEHLVDREVVERSTRVLVEEV